MPSKRSGQNVYENDLILSQIFDSLDSKPAVRNMMLTSKRNFAMGTKVLYKEVKGDILERLGKSNCYLVSTRLPDR